MIYLDYAAHSPADEDVLDIFIKAERDYIANPMSSHALGRLANEKLNEITSGIGRLLKADDYEIIYTSGASEANNLAIKGLARAYKHIGKHIISTSLEHPSVSGALTYLQQQGYEIDLVDIKCDGTVDLEHLRQLLRKDTVIVSVCAVDGELGCIQPLDKIAGILKAYPDCRFHCDAVQAIGKIDFSPSVIDCISITGHKFHGLLGIGILLKRKQVVIEPLIHGGVSGSVYRSGTITLALAAAFEYALKKALEQREERYRKVGSMREYLVKKLTQFDGVRINSPAHSSPYIMNISVKGIKGQDFQAALSRHGICVSVKSACGTPNTPSRAVYEISRDKKNAMYSWRISLSHSVTESDLEGFLTAFKCCYEEAENARA